MTTSAATIDYELDDEVGRLAEEFLARLSEGEKPTAEDYAAEHPHLAATILRVFPALEIMGATPTLSAEGADNAQAGVLGDYRIVREVGRGGMGVVYEAQQISLDRRVALKVLPFAAVLDERQIRRFRNEARAAAQLKHPNLVQVFGVGCERSVHYYAMEFVDGQTLEQVIRDLRRTDGLVSGPPVVESLSSTIAVPDPTTTHQPAEAGQATATQVSSQPSTKSLEYYRGVARLAMQVAEALDHSHQEGVIHRDIKPSNLMIDAAGKPWITDFGLARIEADAGMTMSGDMLGTLRYMSPEQTLANRVVVDHRTDIYSLGVTLYELVTLRPAFPQEDKHELLRHIAFEDPPRPRKLNRHVPTELETIVTTAIQKRPDDRFYASAQEMADDLRRYLCDESVRVRPAGPVKLAAKWARRRWKMITMAACGALAAVITGFAVLGLNYARVVAERDRAEQAEAKFRTEKENFEQLAMEYKQLAAEYKRQNEELEEYNVSTRLIWKKLAEGQADWQESIFAIVDSIYRGDSEQASDLSEAAFAHLVRRTTIDNLQGKQKNVFQQKGKLRDLLHDFELRRIPHADEPTARGGRFKEGCFGVCPRLTFDGQPPITVEAIVTCESLGQRGKMQNIFACTNYGSMSLGTGDGLANDRYALWLADRNGGGYTHVYGQRKIPLGVKQHVAAVWDGAEARLYIDGQFQEKQSIDAEQVRRQITGAPFFIGADPVAGSFAHEHFLGVIEAVRYTRRALYTGTEPFLPPEHLEPTEDVIALIDLRYDDGDYAFDRSGNGNHAMLVGVERVDRSE